ncbi:MAG: IS30 family transposase [Bacteroidales bacterium]|nr:IS30 family transposase [Bacteroidales bacterium]
MGHEHCNAKPRNNKHLKYRERLIIELMIKEKKTTKAIASVIACSQRTIQRELKRGQVQQINGTTWEYYKTYDADTAQNKYIENRSGSGTCLKIGHDHKLCREIERQIKAKRSPDIIANDIKKRNKEFNVTVCTSTLYNYLRKNIFLEVSYKDLVYGRYRKRKDKHLNRPSYKNVRGRSIEERPEEANDRTKQGHWEMDLIVSGKKLGKACLLTLTERKSRKEIIRKLPDKTQESVIRELDKLERKLGRKGFAKMFKTITVDNGTEFLNSIEMERSCVSKGKQRTQVFYAHPYSAFERGSNENLNRMIRRFIPKGTDISTYTKQEIKKIEQWLNTYPRKILDYRTPQEVFNQVA